jgi:non-ribosomal peptide synthetase component F
MPPPTLLSHLSPTDRARFNQLGFGPSRPVLVPIIHHAFETVAHTQPDAVAVEHTLYNESITYAALDVRSNRLARRLRAHGIVPGKRICILARRSVAFVVAVLAVLKSGAQYVPLDAVTITDETLQFVLEDSRPSVVLLMEDYAHRVSGIPTICLEHAIRDDELSGANPGKVEDLSSPTDGAYCIYTSGTTGAIIFQNPYFTGCLPPFQENQKGLMSIIEESQTVSSSSQ